MNADNRVEFTAALRELADFLDAHPAVPAPAYPSLTIHADGETEAERADHVRQLADALGASVTESATSYRAELTFGPLTFSAYASTDAWVAACDGAQSYLGSVRP
jgi:hypothetical protein